MKKLTPLIALALSCLPLTAQVDYDGNYPWSQTTSYAPDNTVPGWFYNLGITGMRVKLDPAAPRTLVVKYVFAGTPAATADVRVDDVITGIEGQLFTEDHQDGYGTAVFGARGPIGEFGAALDTVQGADGLLDISLTRSGNPLNKTLNVGQTYGSFSPTFPKNCPKSDLILSQLLTYIRNTQQADGSWPGGSGAHENSIYAGLALLADGSPASMTAATNLANYYHNQTNQAIPQFGLNNWLYLATSIYLSEYYHKTNAAWVLPKLNTLHNYLLASQYTDISQFIPGHPSADPANYGYGGWGHNPGYEGYGPICMTTGQGALALAMMKRVGVNVDRARHDAAYAFLVKGTGPNQYIWYRDSVDGGPSDWADPGRTGVAAIANWMSPYSEAIYTTRAVDHARFIGNHPQSFPDTHGSPTIGMAYAAMAAHIDPPSFRQLMDNNRWWFSLAQTPEGNFYYQPNRDNAGYDSNPRFVASSVTAFIFSLPKRNLMLSERLYHSFEASFTSPPSALSSSSIRMTATPASSENGPVEYLFTETSGNPGGTSSGWQSSPEYTDAGLNPSTTYTYTVTVRDTSGATTPASAPASATTFSDQPLDLMSLNFYAYGNFTPAQQNKVTLEPTESAGVAPYHVAGWQNYEVPWDIENPEPPFTLTSNTAATATLVLNDVRNGSPYEDTPHTLVAGGDGDLMDGHCNGTEDPYDGSKHFDMTVSSIPYPTYDLVVYLAANQAQFNDGKGKIVLNGGTPQDFTLPAGEFNGFAEITNATTPGNYIIFRNLTNPSFNLKVWGNGFNHLGPAGFQIVNSNPGAPDTTPPTINSLNPADNATGVAVAADFVVTFSEDIARGTGNITIKNLTDGTQTNIPVTDTAQVTISGATLTINPTANLSANKNYAVRIANTAIKDLANNAFAGINDDTTWNFSTVDTIAPTVSSFSPPDNATNVAVNTDLVVTFSESIVAGTGNITVRNLTNSNNTNIPVTDTAQVTISGATLTINPTADLLPGKNYAIRIANTAIKDLANNAFAGISNNTTWNFSTSSADTTAPTPNPMTFASPPAAVDSTSIAMTATTASDPSGVEYRFNNTTLGTSSAWQNSPTYTATGLTPATSYTFTVQARDKSAAQNTTTASAPASATTLSSDPTELMSLNFYAYGSFPPANYNAVTLEAAESAGVAPYNVTGWQNYEVPWGLDSPAAPFTLTSNLGSTATMVLNDVRNGWTHDDTPNPNFGGSGDMMDSQCQGTEDPYDDSAKFDMTVSNIPFQVYDLIVYIGSNQGQFGDGTGKAVLNGGAPQNFTLPSGSFNGFIEITNPTPPGNYIVFRGLRNSSFNLKVWGNGFNHLGPAGFQIVKDSSGLIPPGPASNPTPADASFGHPFAPTLSWTAGLDATSHNVYFGTSPTPGAAEFKGNQTATSYNPSTLVAGIYYWRIDEVNADGTTPGPVWSFSVGSPAKAFRPMPWHGMNAVATNVGTLKWMAGASATASTHNVYFGTNPNPGAAEFKGNQTATTYNPGTLAAATTYYWRIDEVNAQGTTTGDVWSFTTTKTGTNKVKIFLMAGQSNMEGQGEMNPAGTPGTLQTLYNNDPVTYAHLKTGGNWTIRDDTWIWYQRDGTTLVHGGLTAGYGSNSTTIGPELQFGHMMGDHFTPKVLLIKTAWGGKSLRTDFRPPSAAWNRDVPTSNGHEGFYFKQMLEALIDATSNLATYFPAYDSADGYEIAGFAWHQGWNDRDSPAFSAEYEANMAHFIRDVRSAVGVPDLPFVIATTGMDGTPDYSQVELAQLNMANTTAYPEFAGNVAVVDTQSFWHSVPQSPADEIYHWNRNAGSYYKIGQAMAQQMQTLLQANPSDNEPPTLQSINDDAGGGPVTVGSIVTYTVTFSEAMDAATIGTNDFENAGSPAASITSVAATANPAVFTVVVTAPATAGTLQLQIKAGAVLADLAGNPLDTTSPLPDGTTLTVNDPPPSGLACQLGILDVANANGGINPATGQPWALGDPYRLVFVTSATTPCTSTDIATYNNFVQGLANAAGLDTSPLGPVTWKAVGSTATVDARDNTGTNPTTNGTGVPVLRMDGTFVIANNNAELWDGINNSHIPGDNFLTVHLDENRVVRLDDRVRTGSDGNGRASTDSARVLGGSAEATPRVQTGRNFAPDSYGSLGGNNWMRDWSEDAVDAGRLYAMSGILTIIATTAPTPYETWLTLFTFPPGADTTPTGDADRDTRSNWYEFAFGLDPTNAASNNPIIQILNEANLSFQYTRTSDSGLFYKIYYSSDLTHWIHDATATQVPGFGIGSMEPVTVTLGSATPANGRLFVRVAATTAP